MGSGAQHQPEITRFELTGGQEQDTDQRGVVGGYTSFFYGLVCLANDFAVGVFGILSRTQCSA